MKLLAIGDFHGKCPLNLRKICKDNKIELILCTGDYASFHARKIFFKYCYGTNLDLEEVISKKKVNEYERKDMQDAERLLKKLNNLKVPVISTTGNVDRTKYPSVGAFKRDAKMKDIFHPVAKKYKHIKFIEEKMISINEFNIIGYPQSSYPGFLSFSTLIRKPYKINKALDRRKDRKKRAKIFNKLFKEAKHPVIFLVHNPPYNTKLDIITDEEAHEKARGEHYGELLTKQLIKKYKPILCICGHMHECQGIDKIGKTPIVNTGCAADGQYAIIDIKNNKVKVKLK